MPCLLTLTLLVLLPCCGGVACVPPWLWTLYRQGGHTLWQVQLSRAGFIGEVRQKAGPGRSGWGLGVGLTNSPSKNNHVTETRTRASKETTVLGEDGPSAGGFMTPSSESQTYLEATTSTIIISTRTNINIGTWNSTSGSQDETVQSGTARNQWGSELLLFLGYEEDNEEWLWYWPKLPRRPSLVGRHMAHGSSQPAFEQRRGELI